MSVSYQIKRWWTYQRERFPFIKHGPVVAAFSFSAVSYSALLRGGSLHWPAVLAALMSALLFFLLLRISDEFKDAEEDARFRPYRPVPRGLIQLRELGWVGLAAMCIQLVLAVLLFWPLALLLLGVWLYLALMNQEFFVAGWLKRHPVVYLLSHMLIMPLIDLYATAWDWWWSGAALWVEPPAGLHWFLVLSFLNGLVIELGRKIRLPEEEEEGVETYSALWGYRFAAGVWLVLVWMAAVCAWLAAISIGFAWPMVGVLSILVLLVSGQVGLFVRQKTRVSGQRVELLSGVWTLLVYLSLGTLPWFLLPPA